jgi:AbrB family looped-hinge helix DNA binding protein
MGQIVDVGREGRVTLPASVRRQLRLEEGSQLEVAVQDGQVVLTPLVTVPRSVLAQLARHAAEGKIYRGLSRADLERLTAGEEIDLEPFAAPRESFSAGASDVDEPDTRR